MFLMGLQDFVLSKSALSCISAPLSVPKVSSVTPEDVSQLGLTHSESGEHSGSLSEHIPPTNESMR